MSTNLHDSRRPLANTERGSVPRAIGIVIGHPFHHHGLDRRMVDVERETISVNSRTSGNACNVERVEQVAAEATRRSIAELDAVIADLTAHRARLAGGLERGFSHVAQKVMEESTS